MSVSICPEIFIVEKSAHKSLSTAGVNHAFDPQQNITCKVFNIHNHSFAIRQKFQSMKENTREEELEDPKDSRDTNMRTLSSVNPTHENKITITF